MRVYNTLSGQKEEFEPQGDEVKMYVCGVNPYSDAHIGHAMSYVFFDVVRRYLEYRGYKVRHVQNITDIEDNIIATANRLGIPVGELTDKYTVRYDEDMEALNVTRAHVYPKATEEIPKIKEIVEGLIDKGYAYEVGGSVYFRVRKVDDYGKLSRRSVESMMAGEGAVGSEEKESPLDFALWKVAKPDEPSWDSPWGKGRPGWHIECSAMSLKYLGETLDIHGGGQDLIFPHHENEITQSESFTGKKPFVKYWMHNGMVQMGEEKMSKSLGNLITIREALERYSADGIRVFVLNSHYRSPLTYSEEVLEAANRGAEGFVQGISRYDPKSSKRQALDAEPYRKQFEDAMDDDFNTPQALSVLFDLARAINQAGDAGLSFTEAQNTLSRLAREVLGLKIPKKIRVEASATISIESTAEITVAVKDRLNRLAEERDIYRKEKNWQRADEIRNKLAELEVILEDTKIGTTASFKISPSLESLDNIMNELGIVLEDNP